MNPRLLYECSLCHAWVRGAQGREVGVEWDNLSVCVCVCVCLCVCVCVCVCVDRKMGRGVSRVHGVSVRLADKSSAPETNPCMNKSIKPCLCSVCVYVCVFVCVHACICVCVCVRQSEGREEESIR